MWSLPDIFPLVRGNGGAAGEGDREEREWKGTSAEASSEWGVPLGSGLDDWVGVEPAKLIVGSDRGEKLRRREENKWACWQERQGDASGMNHNANLVLLVECFLVQLVPNNLPARVQLTTRKLKRAKKQPWLHLCVWSKWNWVVSYSGQG